MKTKDLDQAAARAERRRMMLEDPIIKVLPIVALPMVLSTLIDSFYNLADTYFVSTLGTAATAAVGVNNSLMHFIRALGMGFGMGGAFGAQMGGMAQGAFGAQPQTQAPPPPPTPQAVAFHVIINGQQAGPYDLVTLQPLVSQGVVTPATLVWRAGRAQWAAAQTVPELAALFGPPAPPTAPPPPMP